MVNLRKEVYDNNSRVPVIEIGTPEEDSFRRDLTLNALFYNLNEKKIEDFTKVGLTDLKERVARTPIDPLKTFLDDPLRVLRVIRFAQRYDLKIMKDVYESALKPEVREAFS